MDINFINSVFKVLSVITYTLYIYMRIMNIKLEYRKWILLTILSCILTGIYMIGKIYIESTLNIFIMYLILYFIIGKLNNNMMSSSMVAMLISIAICFSTLTIAVVVSFFFKPLIIKTGLAILYILLILFIQGITILGFFKIKRFQNGFSFLKKTMFSEYLDVIMINISAMLVLAYCLFGNYYGNVTKNIFVAFMAICILTILMIQKTITLYYKQKLLAKTIDDYKSEIADKDEQIKMLSEEKFKISKLNHEFYNRQKSLEKKVNDFINNANTEIAAELSVIESINKLTKEYSNGLENIKGLEKLQSTEIEEIDDMFKYMQSECKNKNINFALQVNGNIHHLVNKIIPQNKLVTLIGDHIRDAIIAINSSDNNFKSILVILGMKDNCYELCIYDSGIEFEIKTLEKLGLEPATTHKDTGGTGIGFMTTFETLKETKASLIINERHGMSAEDYTKAIVIRFDGKNEYKICSYRADEIRKKIKDNRIIIEEL